MTILNILQVIIIFLLGTALGSFLNVVIDRFATKRSILKGRSYCENCKKELKVIDNIPLLSFLFLKGKCRYCGKKIPFRLFIVELAGGSALLYLIYIFGVSNIWSFIFLVIIVFILLAIFFIDLEYEIIPDKLSLTLPIIAAFYIYNSGLNFMEHLISGVGSLLFFLMLYIVTRGRGMGFGDVKLSFSLGMILGFPMIIYGLYIAFLTGALVSIILIVWKKKSFRKSKIPFGPFLAFSTIFSLLFADSIILPLVSTLF